MTDHRDEQFEQRLAGLAPTEPAGSIVDAAYEAGRRDALAERAKASFPALKLAAVVVLSMGLAGMCGFLVGQETKTMQRGPMATGPTGPTGRSNEQATPNIEQEAVPEQPVAPQANRPMLAVLPWQGWSLDGSGGSPYSVLSMRSAVLTPEGIMLDRLPSGTGTTGGSGSGAGTGGGTAAQKQAIPTPRSIDL